MGKTIQWQTKHNTKFNNVQNFLETLLIDNGVAEESLQGFLHPTKKYVNDPFLLKNMKEAVELIHKNIISNGKIFVKVDPDCDGYFSASMLIQFLKKLNPSVVVDYKLNYEKQHGLTYQDISNFTKDQYSLIIVPDASIKVKDARMIKDNFSADILVLDHHIIENEFFDEESKKWIDRGEAKKIYNTDKKRLKVDCYTNYCTTVNCTDGQYPNVGLCGAGVVQKLIEAYVDTYASVEEVEDCTNCFLDLLSVALIADNMDLRILENRYYTMEGLKERNYNNVFLNELVKHNEENLKWGRYIVSVGWYIAPLINGCIRYGSVKEQDDTFRAILGVQQTIEYQPRRKHKTDPLPPIEYHTLQQTMARVCGNVKNRQDTEVRKFVKEIDQEIQEKNLDKNTILFVDGTKILDRGTVSGLIANRLASKYFRPVVLMREKSSTEYGGSMRGYINSPIKDTKTFLEEVGVTVMGHSNAAGVTFKKDQLDNIIKLINEKLPPNQLSLVYMVGWEIPGYQLTREQVQEVAENYEVFGSTVPAPLFAIKDIEINASEILGYGKNNNFIRFTYNGITFVKKYCTHDEFDNLTLAGRNTMGINKKELRLNIIGEFVLSAWDDKVIPEVKIIDFGVEEIPKTPKKQNFVDDDFLW